MRARPPRKKVTDRPEKGKLLEGWDQIAAYLDKSERTARRMAERGLPVHRAGPGEKPRRYAYTADIDEWFGRRTQPGSPDIGEGPIGRNVALLSGVLLALTGVILLWLVWPRPPRPARVVVEATKLDVYDTHDRRLWGVEYPVLVSDVLSADTGRTNHLLKDVDDDGRLEVLFNYSPADVERGRLICHDEDGRTMWEFPYGREIAAHGRTYEAVFGNAFLRFSSVGDTDYLITVAHHHSWNPTQVALLDPASGEMLDEYIHPGWIYAVELWDVNEDGRDDLLLGGINNPGLGFGHPALVVLEIPFGRAVTEEPNYFGDDNKREHAYFLFPRPDRYAVDGLGTAVMKIFTLGPERLMLALSEGPTFPGLAVYLGTQLQLLDVLASDRLVRDHDRLHWQGRIDHEYRQEELESWRRMVRFETAPDGNSEQVYSQLGDGEQRSGVGSG